MTTEQREAIEICEHYKNILYACNYEEGTERTGQAIDTVLSLIKEQQEKIAKYEKIYKEYDCYRWVKELDKKDKQIDLIIDEFYKKAKISTKCYLQKSVEECMKYKNCKECLKQYFANKVNSKIQ